MKKILLIVLFIVVTFILSGCANTSRFEKGDFVAFGERLDNSPEPLYYLLRFNLEKKPDADITDFCVVLSPDARPVSVKELTVEYVSKYLPPFSPPPQWPDLWKEKAKKYSSYEGSGFYVSFKDGRLVAFSACSHCYGGNYSPVIGTADGDRFYPLPLTREQMEDVFGSPDRVLKVIEVRY